MNSPSPLIPQGSNLEQQNQARSSLKVKIFCALGVNVAVLLVLLMQGCKREQPATETLPLDGTSVYSDTNQPPEMTDTNISTLPPDTNVTVPPPEAYVPPTPPTPPPTTTEYKIEKGDNFTTIGKKFGVSAKAIQTANPNVDPAKLQIGKTIQIPPPTTATTPATGPVVDAASGETIYKVKSGDTLDKLSRQFGTTVKAIQAANGLTDSRIKVGQSLKIPAKTTTP